MVVSTAGEKVVGLLVWSPGRSKCALWPSAGSGVLLGRRGVCGGGRPGWRGAWVGRQDFRERRGGCGRWGVVTGNGVGGALAAVVSVGRVDCRRRVPEFPVRVFTARWSPPYLLFLMVRLLAALVEEVEPSVVVGSAWATPSGGQRRADTQGDRTGSQPGGCIGLSLLGGLAGLGALSLDLRPVCECGASRPSQLPPSLIATSVRPGERGAVVMRIFPWTWGRLLGALIGYRWRSDTGGRIVRSLRTLPAASKARIEYCGLPAFVPCVCGVATVHS